MQRLMFFVFPKFVGTLGIEPKPSDSKTDALANYAMLQSLDFTLIKYDIYCI